MQRSINLAIGTLQNGRRFLTSSALHYSDTGVNNKPSFFTREKGGHFCFCCAPQKYMTSVCGCHVAIIAYLMLVVISRLLIQTPGYISTYVKCSRVVKT